MFSFNNIYEYRKAPFPISKTFKVYPLSEKGMDKYLSKDSYNHQFLGKVNSLMLRQLADEERERNRKLEAESQQNNKKSNEGNVDHTESNNAKNTPKANNINLTHENIVENKNNHLEEKCKKDKPHEQHVENKPVLIQNAQSDKNLHKVTFQQAKEELPINIIENKSAANFFPKKALKYKNYYFIDPFRKKNSEVSQRKPKRFGNDIELAKFRKTFLRNSKLQEKVPLIKRTATGKKYIGFLPCHPPKFNTDASFSLNTATDINNSASNSHIPLQTDASQANEERKSITACQMMIKRLLNTVQVGRSLNNLSQSNLEKICNEDRKKFKVLINNQDNEQKLSEQKLPSLTKIIDQPKIKASYISGNSKIMGENYNPFNFNSDIMQSRVQRNVFGFKYQH